MVLKPRRTADKKKGVSTPMTPAKSTRIDSKLFVSPPPLVPAPYVARTATPTPMTPFLDLSLLPCEDKDRAPNEKRDGLGTAYPSSEALPLAEADEPRKERTPVSKRTSFTSIGKWRDVVAEHSAAASVGSEDEDDGDDQDDEKLDLLELLSPAVYEPATKPNLSVVIPRNRKAPVEALHSVALPNKSVVSRYNPSAAASAASSATPPLPSNGQSVAQNMQSQQNQAKSSPPVGTLSLRSASPGSAIRPQTSLSRPSRSSATSSLVVPSDHEDSSRYNYTSTSSRTSFESPTRVDEVLRASRLIERRSAEPLSGTPRSARRNYNKNKALPPSPGPTANEFVPRQKGQTHTPRPVIIKNKADGEVNLDVNDIDATSVYDRRSSVDASPDGPSPTFNEAVLALQQKLGLLVAPDTRLSIAPPDTRYSTAPPEMRYSVAPHMSAQSHDVNAESEYPGLAALQAEAHDRFDTEATLAPAHTPSRPFSDSSVSRASMSSTSSFYPPLTPAAISRRRSMSDVAIQSPSVPAISPSTQNTHTPADSPTALNMHEVVGVAAAASTSPAIRSQHARARSSDAPQLVADHIRPNISISHASARASVMVSTINVDDGMIVVEETDMPLNASNATKTKHAPPRAAEHVLLRIMANLPSLRDLANTSIINKGMRRVYQQNELSLLKAALRNDSLPSWELREWCTPASAESPSADERRRDEGYNAESYRDAIVTDRNALRDLQVLVLKQCQTFLRPDTVEALSHFDHTIDDAFYRIWCFCKIFGGDRGRDDDVTAQIDWLKGGLLAHQDGCEATCGVGMDFDMSSVLLNPPDHFGACNAGGLAAEQLFDMTEIWNCLAALLQPYTTAIHLARKYGVLDHADHFVAGAKTTQANKEAIVLEEWISYVMSLGPKAVLDLARRADKPEAGFIHARNQGWTIWTLPSYTATRSTFLKEPVSRMYEERLASQPRPQLDSPMRPNQNPEDREASRRRVASLAREIRMARCKSNFQRLPLIDMSLERPWSQFSRATPLTPSLPRTPASATPATPLSASSVYEYDHSDQQPHRPTPPLPTDGGARIEAYRTSMAYPRPAPSPPVKAASTPPRAPSMTVEDANLLLTPVAYTPPTASKRSKTNPPASAFTPLFTPTPPPMLGSQDAGRYRISEKLSAPRLRMMTG